MSSFLHKIFSISEHRHTHIKVCLLGVKITFAKPETVKKKRQTNFYYYKKNNIDITTVPPAVGQLRDIQLANLALLEELDYVCRQANLTYWLDGGTLLGAVRHKGFIPWDDDIDTAMRREDYEKVIEAFQKYSRNPDIFAGFYRGSGGNFLIKVQHRKCRHLFVDIFPWDAYGKRLSVDEQLARSSEIKQILVAEKKDIDFSADDDVIKDKILAVMREKILSGGGNDEQSDYVWGIDFKHAWKNWFTRYEVLHPLKSIFFEGRKFPCLNDPEAFLSRVYGDYMAYPKKLGVGHSMFVKLSHQDAEVIDSLKKSLNQKVTE
jgi:lipopolysaccharide cholinephosphotransferase